MVLGRIVTVRRDQGSIIANDPVKYGTAQPVAVCAGPQPIVRQWVVENRLMKSACGPDRSHLLTLIVICIYDSTDGIDCNGGIWA
jgi:hypothetical protein